MKAVILAGGKGTRLRPYTSVLPKPLMPIGDLPILEIIMRRLEKAGVSEVVIAIGYLGSLIQTYLEQSPISKRMIIRYHLEDKPLGTAGAMMQRHKDAGAALTVGVVSTEVQIQLGVLTLDNGDQITGYDEKPTMSYAASMGIYVYSPTAKSLIEPGEYLDAPTLVLNLIEQGQKVVGFTDPCRWIDIGNHGEYERAQQEYEENPDAFLA
ncbi:MAG: sugar phosphate nucleotidyltransferase [Paracoccaceae bacterium]